MMVSRLEIQRREICLFSLSGLELDCRDKDRLLVENRLDQETRI